MEEYSYFTIEQLNTKDLPIKQSINDEIKKTKSNINEVIEIKDGLEWNNSSFINNDLNSFSESINTTDVSTNPNSLILGFNNFNIDDLDEIKDIGLKLKIQSNKSQLNIKSSLGLNGKNTLSTQEKTEIKYPKLNKNITSTKNTKKWKDLPASLSANISNKAPYKDYNNSKYEAIDLKNDLSEITEDINNKLTELNIIINKVQKITNLSINRKTTITNILIQLNQILDNFIENEKEYWYVYDDSISNYRNSKYEVINDENFDDTPFIKNGVWVFFVKNPNYDENYLEPEEVIKMPSELNKNDLIIGYNTLEGISGDSDLVIGRIYTDSCIIVVKTYGVIEIEGASSFLEGMYSSLRLFVVNNISYLNDSIELITKPKVDDNLEYLNERSNINVRLNTGTYIINDYKIVGTDWLEYNNFNFDIDGDINNLEFEIEGFNNSSNNITCNVQCLLEDKKTGVYNIGNIQPGGFSQKVQLDNIFKDFEVNNESFSVRISFVGINGDSMIEIYKTNLKIDYSSIINKVKTFIEHEDIEASNLGTTTWLTIKMDDLWGLNSSIPNQTTGKDIKNTVLAFINFGSLNKNEFIKFYSAELIILYKNRKAFSISKPVESYNKTLISTINSVEKNDNSYYGENIESDEIIFEQNNYETYEGEFVNLKLQHSIYQMFEVSNSSLSGIEFGVNGLNGVPQKTLNLEILENTSLDKPGKSIYKKVVDGWSISNDEYVKYDVNIENLSIGSKYWIKISLDKFDKNNYYNLKYKNNISNLYNSLIIKNGNNETYVGSGSGVLTYKIYTRKNLLGTSKNMIATNIQNEVKIKNNFFRRNEESNTYLDNLTLRFGDLDE